MKARCDFCAAEPGPPLVHHPCADFIEVIELDGHKRQRPLYGPWAACPACDELIRAGRRADLAKRSAAQTGESLELMEAMHAGFWEHRQPGLN